MSKVKRKVKGKGKGKRKATKTANGMPVFKPNARDDWSMRNLGTRYIAEGLARDGVKSIKANGRTYHLSKESDLESLCAHRSDNTSGNGAVPISKIVHAALKALSREMRETEE
ncbi:hypothetical protein LCGC14_2470340 [marine sediment metagenome]|uniref:Uncharacterized protein n=1 Tax=marine sediment metagenome TaxID=412755 RepID=A0A0F9BYC0_9ZZZZ